MNGRVVPVILLSLSLAFVPYFTPEAFPSKFTEGGIVGKIVMMEAGSTEFQVDVEGKTFSIKVTGEGITSLEFSQDEAAIFLETGGTEGTIEMEIPKELLDGTLTVMAGQQEVEFDLSENEANSVLLFDKPAGSSVITIHGTTVIPEFPVAIPIILFAGTVALALMIIRARGNWRI